MGIAEGFPGGILGKSSHIMVKCSQKSCPALLSAYLFLSDNILGVFENSIGMLALQLKHGGWMKGKPFLGELFKLPSVSGYGIP